MARPKNHTPTYKKHSSTGLARCWVNGRWITLGKYGSPESRAEFARIIAELATSPIPQIGPTSLTGTLPAALLTIDQLLLAFLAHAERHYRGRDGEPTDEVREIQRSVLHLHTLYGHTPAMEFGPRALAAVRQAMVSADWCRTLINRRMERIKRAFKWAVSQELVPVTVYEALRTLPGLQKGRTEAREAEPVKPVDPAHVRATLPFLTAHVRTMIELQLLTGMRPGEVCALRLSELDRASETWLYRPAHHKTAHRGQERVIPFGPKARAALVAFLLRDGAPPEGFGSLEAIGDAGRLVMADAYQEAGRERDARLLRDLALPNSFLGKEDKGLKAKLAAEMPAILAWAARGFVRLRCQGMAFTRNAAADHYQRELEDLSSPIRAFIRERCAVGPDREVTVTELFESWKNWNEQRNREPGAENLFGRDLRAAKPHIVLTQPRKNGVRVRMYRGIGLRPRDDWGEEDDVARVGTRANLTQPLEESLFSQ